MKHTLLGTTALMAAGLLIGGEASAADRIRLGLGGYYLGAAGVVFGEDNEAPNLRSHVFKQDAEVHIKGETTLDNGITVGARIELEAQVSSDQIDEIWAHFRGGFGEIRFGDDDDAYAQLCYIAPTAAGNFGADSPFFNFSNASAFGRGLINTNGTCFGLSGDATKIIYFSPSFGGFSFAASYAPDGMQDRRNLLAGAGTAPDNNGGQASEVWSVAATFVHDFNGFSLAAGGGYATGEYEASAASDPEHWNAYAQVGFGGFTVGGAWTLRENTSNTTGLDAEIWAVGATYGIDAWTVGAGFSWGEYDNVGGDDDELKIYQVNANYALGPGIDLQAMVGYNDYDAGTLGGNVSYDGWEAGVGFSLGF